MPQTAVEKELTGLVKDTAGGIIAYLLKYPDQNQTLIHDRNHIVVQLFKKIEEELNSRTNSDLLTAIFNIYLEAHRLDNGKGELHDVIEELRKKIPGLENIKPSDSEAIVKKAFEVQKFKNPQGLIYNVGLPSTLFTEIKDSTIYTLSKEQLDNPKNLNWAQKLFNLFHYLLFEKNRPKNSLLATQLEQKGLFHGSHYFMLPLADLKSQLGTLTKKYIEQQSQQNTGQDKITDEYFKKEVSHIKAAIQAHSDQSNQEATDDNTKLADWTLKYNTDNTSLVSFTLDGGQFLEKLRQENDPNMFYTPEEYKARFGGNIEAAPIFIETIKAIENEFYSQGKLLEPQYFNADMFKRINDYIDEGKKTAKGFEPVWNDKNIVTLLADIAAKYNYLYSEEGFENTIKEIKRLMNNHLDGKAGEYLEKTDKVTPFNTQYSLTSLGLNSSQEQAPKCLLASAKKSFNTEALDFSCLPTLVKKQTEELKNKSPTLND